MSSTLLTVLTASSLFAGACVFLCNRRHSTPSPQAWWNSVEVVLTILAGALAARLFVWTLLSQQPFGDAGVVFVEWAFLFWPGVIETLSRLMTGRVFFESGDVVIWATVFGVLAGFWDGLHRIHDWRRTGGMTFLLDVTWGGAATNIGVASHFLNLGWGKPIDSRRLGAHRYDAGVCTNRQYAIALGNVCGNLRGSGEGSLFRHESIHVFQNRVFGPFYLFSYLFWMAALFVPAMIWGVVVGRPGEMIYAWCYANNPWEEWAYRYGGGRPEHLIWPTRRIVSVSLLVVMLATLLLFQVTFESATTSAAG